jgi:hypothetical protein
VRIAKPNADVAIIVTDQPDAMPTERWSTGFSRRTLEYRLQPAKVYQRSSRTQSAAA